TLRRARSRSGCAGPASGVYDSRQLGQVANLEPRRPEPVRQRRARPVDPYGVDLDGVGARHVDVGTVADEERLPRANAEATERFLEDRRLRLAPAHLVRDRKSTRLNSSHQITSY